MAEAAKKFKPYPGRRPRAIVSDARLATGTLEDVMDVARRFVDDGTFEEILVVTEDEVIPIKR